MPTLIAFGPMAGKEHPDHIAVQEEPGDVAAVLQEGWAKLNAQKGGTIWVNPALVRFVRDLPS